MELHEAIAKRAMVRSFSTEPVEPAVVDRILADALRSPTAGNTGGTAWVVLEGPEQTRRYWEATTDLAWRRSNPNRFAGLSRAPVILLAYTSPEAYVVRYSERDKSGTDLGRAVEAWPVPYWFGDAAFGVMTVLLDATDAGLGACVLGAFRGESALSRTLGVPEGWRLYSAVAMGWPDGRDFPSRSLERSVPPLSERIHRGGWGQQGLR